MQAPSSRIPPVWAAAVASDLYKPCACLPVQYASGGTMKWRKTKEKRRHQDGVAPRWGYYWWWGATPHQFDSLQRALAIKGGCRNLLSVQHLIRNSPLCFPCGRVATDAGSIARLGIEPASCGFSAKQCAAHADGVL